MFTYSATLGTPAKLVHYLARLLRSHNRALGTRANTRAPSCHNQAILVLRHARDHELSHLVLDGIVISTGRCSEKITSAKGKEVELWYSGKAHTHGGKDQGLMGPDWFPLFVSPVEPGSVHDLPAAHTHVLGSLHAVLERPTPRR